MSYFDAEFVISAFRQDQYPADGLPEIALAGRSNVGKSSLINKLLNRKKLARTSSTPGKTQSINFYRVENSFYFADVPGYGFARVPKEIRASWGKLMNSYLIQRAPLRVVMQLVDLRHQPTAEDCQMYDFCRHHEIPTIIVATKADKIKRGHQKPHVLQIQKKLGLTDKQKIILFSSHDGTGKDELWEVLNSYLG